jgi:LmbE family N-acetylglucosaminyl deacetylase
MDGMTASSTDYLDSLRSLPSITVADLLRGRHLLVVAPHPDDESLGVGGLIAAAAASGHRVTVAFLTSGEASHPGSVAYPPGRLGEQRRSEAIAALAELGLSRDRAVFLGLPDGEVAGCGAERQAEAMRQLISLMGNGNDSLVCVTAPTDPHGDHRAAYALAHEACRETRCELLTYPVWTWVQDAANLPARPAKGWRIDIAAQRARKAAAIRAHRSQHGLLVTDATEAFVMDEAFLACFDTDHEVLVADHASL